MSPLCMRSWAPDNNHLVDVHLLTSVQTMLNAEDASLTMGYGISMQHRVMMVLPCLRCAAC